MAKISELLGNLKERFSSRKTLAEVLKPTPAKTSLPKAQSELPELSSAGLARAESPHSEDESFLLESDREEIERRYKTAQADLSKISKLKAEIAKLEGATKKDFSLAKFHSFNEDELEKESKKMADFFGKLKNLRKECNKITKSFEESQHQMQQIKNFDDEIINKYEKSANEIVACCDSVIKAVQDYNFIFESPLQTATPQSLSRKIIDASSLIGEINKEFQQDDLTFADLARMQESAKKFESKATPAQISAEDKTAFQEIIKTCNKIKDNHAAIAGAITKHRTVERPVVGKKQIEASASEVGKMQKLFTSNIEAAAGKKDALVSEAGVVKNGLNKFEGLVITKATQQRRRVLPSIPPSLHVAPKSSIAAAKSHSILPNINKGPSKS